MVRFTHQFFFGWEGRDGSKKASAPWPLFAQMERKIYVVKFRTESKCV